MRTLTKVKKFARLIQPPIITQWLAHSGQPPEESTKPYLEYAPEGWRALQTISNKEGWNLDNVIETETAKWKVFCDDLQGAGPLGFSHEHTDLTVIRDLSFHNIHITYAYVLALTANQKSR